MSSDSVNNNKEDLSEALSSLNIKYAELLQCSNCGKEGDGDSMILCNKCDLVKYCNAACKKKHKSKHKKKCERRVAELYDVKSCSKSLRHLKNVPSACYHCHIMVTT